MVLQAAWTITDAAQGWTGVFTEAVGVVTTRDVTWQAPAKAGITSTASAIETDAPAMEMAGEVFFGKPIILHGRTTRAIAETIEHDTRCCRRAVVIPRRAVL